MMIRSFFQNILHWWRNERPIKKEINYLYFSFFLLVLCILTLSHFFRTERALFGVPLFFLIYALGQAILEVFSFILVALLLKRWTPRWIYCLFIALSFALLLLHFTNFTLVRLTDAPMSLMFKFFFGSGLNHFIAAFQALNMNWTIIVISVAGLLLIPIIGLLFYGFTHLVAKRKPFKISLSQIAIAIGSMAMGLFLLDIFAHPFLNRHVYAKYQKVLPFGTTFITPALQCIRLDRQIALPPNEKQTQKLLKKLDLSISHRPNIYLVVIETLRKDFVTEEIAPNLAAFGQQNISFPSSYSNGNSTYLSWFAIFHANFPYYWTAVRDEWNNGSVPLQLLKKMGYKIRVYSSADFQFFNMDKLLFGSKGQNADQIEEYSLIRSIEPCDRDALALDSFARDVKNETAKEGNVFLIFLDSTHSEYSFPKDFPLKFEPICKEIDYLTIGPMKKELEQIKNRYKNSIHYIDHLMGRFFQVLNDENLYDDAVIAITGDHGEEFFEEGALFHGSHLNQYQTSVPLFLKFPSKDWIPLTKEATHIDLFPSILHYLTEKSDFQDLFNGQSIFLPNSWPYRLTVHQNGTESPCEFLIEKDEKKMRARFVDPNSDYSKNDLEILDLQIPGDCTSGLSLENQIKVHFPDALTPLLEKR